ncbi:ABC transporter-like [Syntrophomonas zehnderi OL-4]|uniref:ABC transporter-like n=2 Tax=Syntrophomonas TaxID=862 RepID=A0A0E4GCN9_9FIRM|nr:ABC transporter ATP-binding protein [Syntrophomonas zehnderi]CFY02395.1 ABC transporter-like [Syntrophomonas zehnderi OL-4]
MKMLTVKGIDSGYGDITVLKDITLSIEEGEVISIVGANGAGKTTLLNTISGIIRPKSGEIWLDNQRIDKLPAHKITELGIVQVPEGRRIFPLMTVYENLLIGSSLPRAKSKREENLEYVFDLLPRLAERKDQVGRTMSGGEQQMLAIGRALMAMPRLLMLDEPSMGLSPLLVNTVFDVISKIGEQNITVLLVEQNVKKAMRLSQRSYVLENGYFSMEGSSEELLNNPHIKKAYLGL